MIRLTDEEIDWGVGNDNMYYKGAFNRGAKAQLKKLAGELDIKFLLNILKQTEDIIWQKKGRHKCRLQIRKLEALLKETS